MKKLILILLILGINCSLNAQSYSAYTSYGWDEWESNKWEYKYPSDGWVYAVWRYGNIRDFHFRFNYSELGLHELHGDVWKNVKKDNKCLRNLHCTFEYYVTDDYPTLKDALEKSSWPCAKFKYNPYENRPIVLRSAKAKVNVCYDDNDEIRALNFWIDGVGFAITVHWDYTGYNMRYSY